MFQGLEFEHFTRSNTRNVLKAANSLANRRGAKQVKDIDLLLALLRECHETLRSFAPTLTQPVRVAIEADIGRGEGYIVGPDKPSKNELPLSANVKRILACAKQQASELNEGGGQLSVRLEHLLLGMLTMPVSKCQAPKLLKEPRLALQYDGLTFGAVREKVAQLGYNFKRALARELEDPRVISLTPETRQRLFALAGREVPLAPKDHDGLLMTAVELWAEKAFSPDQSVDKRTLVTGIDKLARNRAPYLQVVRVEFALCRGLNLLFQPPQRPGGRNQKPPRAPYGAAASFPIRN